MKWIALSFLFLTILHADEPPKPIKPFYHRVQFGPDMFWSHFRSSLEEDNRGTKLSYTIDGFFGGLRASYDYLQPVALYAGTEGVVAWGRDNIRRKKSDSKSRYKHEGRLWANLEQRLGYNAQSTLFPEFIATPYLGLGWHYEGTSNDHAHWYYGAGGFKTIQRFYQKFEIGIDLKFIFNFDIHDKGIISVSTTQWKQTFWGFETALPLRWLIGSCRKWDIEFKPYLLKLNLNSPQTIFGARLLAGYSF